MHSPRSRLLSEADAHLDCDRDRQPGLAARPRHSAPYIAGEQIEHRVVEIAASTGRYRGPVLGSRLIRSRFGIG